MTHTAFINYVVPVPGSTVTAYLAQRRDDPSTWIYSLWEDKEYTDGYEDTYLAAGDFDLKGLAVTPDQVARIAFVLELEYK